MIWHSQAKYSNKTNWNKKTLAVLYNARVRETCQYLVIASKFF
ncbi:hypothetical protein P378_07455 [Desulforamulus profundi]|uniref:Uncharacterized protein n=1 Tax=Desulforamulus profundi TaxID=1383067 RepID=A0A2C6MFD8_9FIRM|nr:hypothetical protein P378_07455 [Desulforamulus profundi]